MTRHVEGVEELTYPTALREVIPRIGVEIHGCAENWVSPVVILDAPDGFGEETWDIAVPDTLIAWVIAGADVVSEMPGRAGRRAAARSHKIALQPRGSQSRYHASGKVRFGHFYIPDALLNRVCDGL